MSKPLDAPTTDTPQSFLYPLVQILDHEPPLTDENENVQDNPAQDKYRILAHDLIRGLVDPGLKPDRSQRARLERIIGSPSHHLSTEEKDLLWRFRFSLVDNRRALPKFSRQWIGLLRVKLCKLWSYLINGENAALSK